jgi:hypothetical protein
MSVCGECKVGCAVFIVYDVCTSNNYWDCLDSSILSLSPARAVNHVWVLEAQEGCNWDWSLELSELGDDEAVGLFLRSLFIEPWTGG